MVDYVLNSRGVKVVDSGLEFGKEGFTRHRTKRFHGARQGGRGRGGARTFAVAAAPPPPLPMSSSRLPGALAAVDAQPRSSSRAASTRTRTTWTASSSASCASIPTRSAPPPPCPSAPAPTPTLRRPPHRRPARARRRSAVLRGASGRSDPQSRPSPTCRRGRRRPKARGPRLRRRPRRRGRGRYPPARSGGVRKNEDVGRCVFNVLQCCRAARSHSHTTGPAGAAAMQASLDVISTRTLCQCGLVV